MSSFFVFVLFDSIFCYFGSVDLWWLFLIDVCELE